MIRSTIALVALCGVSSVAIAQNQFRSDDVVVMRRTIAPPNMKPDTVTPTPGVTATPTPGVTPTPSPTPTPGSAGTPTPTPTPTPGSSGSGSTPTPTPTSSAARTWVPLTAAVIAGGVPQSGSLLSFDTTQGAACMENDVSVVRTLCASGASSLPGFGTITSTVTTEPRLRTAVFDPNALKAQAPSLTDQGINQLCSSSVNFGGETWKLRCDPDLLRMHYEKVATLAMIQAPTLPYPSVDKPKYQYDLSFSTNAGGIKCRDTDTGEFVSSSLCDYLPDPTGVGTVTVQATYSPPHRIAVFNRDDISAKAPGVSVYSCNSSMSVKVTGGTNEWWGFSCNPADISGVYVKVPYAGYPFQGTSYKAVERGFVPATQLSTTDMQPWTDTMPVTVTAACMNTTTGKVVAYDTNYGSEYQKYCLSLANPPSVKTYNIKASYHPYFRKALIDPEDLMSQVSQVTAAQLCGKTFTLVPGKNPGYNQPYESDWKTTCNPDDVVDNYVRKISKIYAGDIGNAFGGPSTGKPLMTMQLPTRYSTTNTICLNKTTGIEVAIDKCGYMSYPVEADLPKISVTLQPAYRKVLVDMAEVRSKFPYTINFGKQTEAEFLQSQPYISSVTVPGVTKSESWRMTTNPDDMIIKHEVVNYSIGYRFLDAPSGRLALSGASYDTDVQVYNSQYGCRILATGAISLIDTQSSLGSCAYFPLQTGDRPLRVTLNPSNKTMLVKRSNFMAVFPNARWPNSCNQTFKVRGPDGEAFYTGSCVTD